MLPAPLGTGCSQAPGALCVGVWGALAFQHLRGAAVHPSPHCAAAGFFERGQAAAPRYWWLVAPAMTGPRGFCLGDEQEDFRGEAAREQMVPAKGLSSAEFAAKLKIKEKLTAPGAGGDKPDAG